MRQDFIFGLKLLFKQRAFTAAALLTLALAIGANTAIFTVLEKTWSSAGCHSLKPSGW